MLRQTLVVLAVAILVLFSFAFITAGDKAGFPDLKAKSLSIVDGDGKSVITMQNTERGPGIWMTAPNGDHVILTAIDGQTAVYLMSKDSKEADLALAISFGKPYIQTRKGNGEIIMIDPGRLEEGR